MGCATGHVWRGARVAPAARRRGLDVKVASSLAFCDLVYKLHLRKQESEGVLGFVLCVF